ncbi:MAG: gliding motility protein GldE [Candidatus Poribacteria bacterium]|nr:MAG: gliding motility protein GldE [Candidatus Poribacteria bacterium]
MSDRAPVIGPGLAARGLLAAWVLLGGLGTAVLAQTTPLPQSVRNGVLLVYLGLVLVGILASAFFSGSETAFLSANRARLQSLAEAGNRRASAALRLSRHRERTQAMLLLGTNFANVLAAAGSLKFLDVAFPALDPDSRDLINTAVMTPLILLLAEILPKAVARARPDALWTGVGPALLLIDRLLRPISLTMLGIVSLLMRLTGQEGQPQILTREDLRRLAEVGEASGVLARQHRRMIDAVLDLPQLRVESVMRPLSEVISVPEGTPIEDFLALVAEHGHSRIPVYRDRVDRIVGLVYVLDVIYSPTAADTIDHFIRRELLFVPESKRVATLLTELRFRGNPMAFVVDEYGGVVGIVTIEDLIEEIVGEIRDERDEPEEGFQVDRATRTILCEGRASVEALNEVLGEWSASLPEGDYETIAGLVLDRLDRIPKPGDAIQVGRVRVLVLEADERSVRRLQLSLLSKSEGPEEADREER